MEHKGLLLCSQQPATVPVLSQIKHPTQYILHDIIQIILGEM